MQLIVIAKQKPIHTFKVLGLKIITCYQRCFCRMQLMPPAKSAARSGNHSAHRIGRSDSSRRYRLLAVSHDPILRCVKAPLRQDSTAHFVAPQADAARKLTNTQAKFVELLRCYAARLGHAYLAGQNPLRRKAVLAAAAVGLEEALTDAALLMFEKLMASFGRSAARKTAGAAITTGVDITTGDAPARISSKVSESYSDPKLDPIPAADHLTLP